MLGMINQAAALPIPALIESMPCATDASIAISPPVFHLRSKYKKTPPRGRLISPPPLRRSILGRFRYVSGFVMEDPVPLYILPLFGKSLLRGPELFEPVIFGFGNLLIGPSVPQ